LLKKHTKKKQTDKQTNKQKKCLLIILKRHQTKTNILRFLKFQSKVWTLDCIYISHDLLCLNAWNDLCK